MALGTITVKICGEGRKAPTMLFSVSCFEGLPLGSMGSVCPGDLGNGVLGYTVPLTEKNFAAAKERCETSGWSMEVVLSEEAREILEFKGLPLVPDAVVKAPEPVAEVLPIVEEKEEQPRPQRGRPRKNKEF